MIAAGESEETRRKRLRIRAWRRGMREMDLILGGFLDREGASLDGDALDAFETLLARPDPDLYGWFARSEAPEDARDEEITLVSRIRDGMANTTLTDTSNSP